MLGELSLDLEARVTFVRILDSLILSAFRTTDNRTISEK